MSTFDVATIHFLLSIFKRAIETTFPNFKTLFYPFPSERKPMGIHWAVCSERNLRQYPKEFKKEWSQVVLLVPPIGKRTGQCQLGGVKR
jgi:hypothetical protein